ncbi:MAG: NAD-glutamate dehydrogenase [Desulfuromonadales bacterium]|nr:NAD-glutamate dehydrogenase [Desulfuromonadales bacterium]
MNELAIDNRILQKVRRTVIDELGRTTDNLEWLREQMHPYFFITMKKEVEAIADLAKGLGWLRNNRRRILAETERKLILACLSQPGSLYETMRNLQEKEISYAHIAHSFTPVPGTSQRLEIQRFEFDRKSPEEIREAGKPRIPQRIRKEVLTELRQHYPDFHFDNLDPLLGMLWINNESYVRISPAKRVAQILWLYQQGNDHGGVFLASEETEGEDHQRETRLLFAVGNPPQKDFLYQTLEVLKRLGLQVRRAYCLTINNGMHPYFLSTFYVRTRDDKLLESDSEQFFTLQKELYNTQILGTETEAYREFVTNGIMTGEEAALTNAFIAFCHTNLAHNNQPRFDLEGVSRAFHSHPDITLKLIKLFRLRFDPDLQAQQGLYQELLLATEKIIASYNTGRRSLDEFRRTIFQCCVSFIRHTLKTNFFVLEKHALAFRIAPAYLADLDDSFTSGLPTERPFRVTFFFSRHGSGYHIGFSDIARGGWRTILTRTRDEYVTTANTLFREVYVLAHTQHLKNKDIYEGGSKMGVVLRAGREDDHEKMTRRLYKLQYGFINAFLDIFVTRDGKAVSPRVIDYYGEDEPIELGPDENMHDEMIELIARLSSQRGYLLGAGVISSKKVGINHKEYGVTSTGVVKFAEITMEALGINMHSDSFSLKLTGGPNGDVAGNALRLLLQRCPKIQVRLIVDGTGALYDPVGADHKALKKLVLKHDIEAFDPLALHAGGFLLYRNQQQTDGLRQLYRKVSKDENGIRDEWISPDDFFNEYSRLIFTVDTDLFIPAGGRPETIDNNNWQSFLDDNGTPSTRAIIEGANSFLTPTARNELQKCGVVIMRDSSANKCGVISSSYEIIANLLLTDKEFMANKERYVADVIGILERRAQDEARLILRRHREQGGTKLYTEISDEISREINNHYARLFAFFQKHAHLCSKPLFRRAILAHLPHMLQAEERYRRRLKRLPEKYLFAILASEIASSMVYRENREADFLGMLEGHLQRSFGDVGDRIAS